MRRGRGQLCRNANIGSTTQFPTVPFVQVVDNAAPWNPLAFHCGVPRKPESANSSSSFALRNTHSLLHTSRTTSGSFTANWLKPGVQQMKP
jgi:hypothetical protein